jgi:hypothetical protein
MIDLETWAARLPDILSARWEGHWAEVAVGGVLLIYAFVSIFIGNIWSGGNVSSDDKPLSFWGAIAGYATAGFTLALYI